MMSRSDFEKPPRKGDGGIVDGIRSYYSRHRYHNLSVCHVMAIGSVQQWKHDDTYYFAGWLCACGGMGVERAPTEPELAAKLQAVADRYS